VSRQGLGRGAYNEEILFEDLVARYWARLDTSAIAHDGTSGTLTGLLHTTGIKTSSATAGDLIHCFANIADVIQQINTSVGGLGYAANKIVVYPRRWGAWTATLDSTSRPLLGINGLPMFTAAGEGERSGYGFVGHVQGLPVYTDANVPTNLGTGTNEDRILIFASPVSDHVDTITFNEKWPNIDVTGMGAAFVERLLGIGDASRSTLSRTSRRARCTTRSGIWPARTRRSRWS